MRYFINALYVFFSIWLYWTVDPRNFMSEPMSWSLLFSLGALAIAVVFFVIGVVDTALVTIVRGFFNAYRSYLAMKSKHTDATAKALQGIMESYKSTVENAGQESTGVSRE